MTEPAFSRRTTTLLAWSAGLSLLAGFAAVVFAGGGAGEVESSGADSFSASALGHAALVDLLEASGRRVVRSQARSGHKARDRALLLLLEPGRGGERSDRDARALEDIRQYARHSLLVLPKWRGEEDPDHPGWLRSVDLVPQSTVDELLAEVASGLELVRLGEAEEIAVSGSRLQPSLARPQLVRGAAPNRVVAGGASGALLMRLHGPTTWLLSDPDVLSNHGLGKGDNAAFVLEALERIAPPDAAIVIDETLHGFAAPPDVFGQLGRFPLVLVLAQSVAALACLLWAGMVRFGSPDRPAADLQPGKQVLLVNTAELLRLGGHTLPVLQRYCGLAERRVAAAYHLPQDLQTAERRARLRRIGRARGTTRDLDEVVAAVEHCAGDRIGVEHRALAAGRLIRQWWKEMADGDR